MGADKDAALFAECKWTNEKVDFGVLETLVERSTLFNYRKKHFSLRRVDKIYISQYNKLISLQLVSWLNGGEDVLLS